MHGSRYCYRDGELLPRRFNLTPIRYPEMIGTSIGAVCFLLHFPSGHPAPLLAGILPGGARTFLPDIYRGDRPSTLSLQLYLAQIWRAAPDNGSRLRERRCIVPQAHVDLVTPCRYRCDQRDHRPASEIAVVGHGGIQRSPHAHSG